MKKTIYLYKNEYVEIDGKTIYFDIEKKKIKNMYIKVKADKKIVISIPERYTIKKARDFVISKIDWIKKQQEIYEAIEKQKVVVNFKNGDIVSLLGKKYKLKIIPNKKNNIEVKDEIMKIYIKEKYINKKDYIKKFYEKWLKIYALNIFEKIVMKYQEILQNYQIPMPEIEVKKLKSRWGSCIPLRKKVTFNLQLIKTPIYCIEYVVLHELSHFKYQNHSKYFYNFIGNIMPDWKERKKILNKQYIYVE